VKNIRVILADDHPIVREGIRSLLERVVDISVVAEAKNGAEVLPLINEYNADVLILDIEMPTVSGVEVARLIKEREIPIRILALSAHNDDRYIHEIMMCGASGYLMKEEASNMIVEAVRGVASGQEGWMSRQASAQLTMRARSDIAHGLTPREKEVLHFIVDGKSNQEIARELKISGSTVEKHVSSILTKLNVVSRVEAAVHAVRNGWT